MKKYLSLFVVVALFSPVFAAALECAEGEELVPEVTHTEEVTNCEFKGFWTWGLNSQCQGSWNLRQFAYHEVTEEVEVVDEEAYCKSVEVPEEEPVEEETSGGSSQSYGGGGGFTYCDLHAGIAVTEVHQCIDRSTGQVMQTLAWRSGASPVWSYQSQVNLYMQLLLLLQQMVEEMQK